VAAGPFSDRAWGGTSWPWEVSQWISGAHRPLGGGPPSNSNGRWRPRGLAAGGREPRPGRRVSGQVVRPAGPRWVNAVFLCSSIFPSSRRGDCVASPSRRLDESCAEPAGKSRVVILPECAWSWTSANVAGVPAAIPAPSCRLVRALPAASKGKIVPAARDQAPDRRAP